MTTNPAATPVPVEDVQGDRRWMDMHEHYVREAHEKEPEVLFVGDSLILQLAHTQIWTEKFEPMHCLNFACGGDATQHVLWRLQNGELKNIAPKAVVFLAGTNNHGHTAEQVAGGIEACVRTIVQQQPQAKILVLTIPPRGHQPNPLRVKNEEVNQRIASLLQSFPSVQLVDVCQGLLQSDGTINHNDMYDYLHLTSSGYAKFCEPLYCALAEILKMQDATALAMDAADNLVETPD
ncbi:platelet-activating factor acetylhydrolase IB subunit beta-like [Branchiostoma floridae]|uniref:1-alkyl-2-acetylglycerophosphocholine esterase n=1 Tax=Branchiostoma floridae TaxID=7739 RepID=A0A9J7KXN7_BRAFL|nr:platelet-activating factor acetylhydrolase IB subunit beta-like [Branchiostoma floridae]